MRTFKMGELAERSGVGIETVRYYERIGLMPEPSRRESGYREYPPESVDRLRFIRRAKDLGFTLKQIDQLLSISLDGDVNCLEVSERARVKLREIDRKIADLRRMRDSLACLADACNGDRPSDACPIIEALNGGNDDEHDRLDL